MILLTKSGKRLQIRFKELSQSPSGIFFVTDVKLWRHEVAHPSFHDHGFLGWKLLQLRIPDTFG